MNNEDKVYFIGQGSYKPTNSKLQMRWLIAGITLVIVAIFGFLLYTAEDEKPSQLDVVEVVPEDAVAPKFAGNKDISEFLFWISENLQYPEGHETEDAYVVVSFVVSKTGVVEDILIEKEPKEKAFGKQVMKLLQSCPKWTPGRLADGTPIGVKYTLPVRFSKTKR